MSKEMFTTVNIVGYLIILHFIVHKTYSFTFTTLYKQLTAIRCVCVQYLSHCSRESKEKI